MIKVLYEDNPKVLRKHTMNYLNGAKDAISGRKFTR